MTPEARQLRDQNRAAQRHGRMQFSPYGVLSRQRVAGSVDASQLATRESVQLRVLETDVDGVNVLTTDVGKFWFVPGYSRVGGPDVVRP
jgi:hypothetical protein